jgi:DUF1680 family protein
VRLLPGPFEDARALDARYLLSLNADRLLHGFRSNAGLAPKAARYSGWESGVLCPGHTLGHYLSACSMMWASTGQAAFRQRVAYVVDELAACQQAAGSGLVCAFPDGDTQLRNVIAGRPVTGVPWYTMHKILVGLLDAHLYTAHTGALPALRRLADWMVEATQGISDQRFQDMLGIEFGGMNEAMAEVHALTGDTRHLQLAQRFNHRSLLDPLSEGRDTLDGLHSNTQIPKVIGFQRLAEATGEERYARAARYFWGTVVHRRSFATGGNGEAEHFFPPAEAQAPGLGQNDGDLLHPQHAAAHALTVHRRALGGLRRLLRRAVQRHPGLAGPGLGHGHLLPAHAGLPKLYGTAERSFWSAPAPA